MKYLLPITALLLLGCLSSYDECIPASPSDPESSLICEDDSATMRLGFEEGPDGVEVTCVCVP